MAHFIIDLMGDDDVIVIKQDDPTEDALREEMRRRALEEILRRSPQPTLQIIPTIKRC
jgi:hypothetical protein